MPQTAVTMPQGLWTAVEPWPCAAVNPGESPPPALGFPTTSAWPSPFILIQPVCRVESDLKILLILKIIFAHCHLAQLYFLKDSYFWGKRDTQLTERTCTGNEVGTLPREGIVKDRSQGFLLSCPLLFSIPSKCPSCSQLA